MIRHYFKITLFSLLTLCFNRCAQVAPLTGGARDTVPPKLLEALPQQAALNFNNDEIVLRFDEYVQLKDLKNQLLISPKIKTEPEISSEGKKIIVLIKKNELAPNTTYRIYFGKSVADMTEGNTIPNFEYVFSTGNYIDSLKVKGTIVEAFNEKPAGEVLVGLYNLNKQNDSLIYKETPDYITRTLPGGEFSFGNLPKSTFKAVAFTDKNKNYLYDGESEKIGFKDSVLVLSSDTILNLKIFSEEPSKTFIKKSSAPYYGILNVIYNKKSVFKANTLNAHESGLVTETETGREKDTVTFYYSGIKDTLGVIIKDVVSQKTDTVKITLPTINTRRKKTLTYSSSLLNSALPVNVPLKLNFINSLDTSKTNPDKLYLIYLKDSLRVKEPVTLSYSWPNGVYIKNKLKEGVDYRLKIDTAAFYDLNGKYNDSSIVNFKLQSKTELGKMSIKVLLNKKQAYIIQLLNDKGQVAKEDYIRFSLSSSNAATVDFTDVTPGTYMVKIIFDDNENKKWDTGNYLRGKQPEKVYISSKQIKVLPDWEMEEEILIK